MERIVVKSRTFDEAELADIQQQIHMTPYERQEIARILKERFYGSNMPDVRSRKAAE